jgi:hypothetical protein
MAWDCVVSRVEPTDYCWRDAHSFSILCVFFLSTGLIHGAGVLGLIDCLLILSQPFVSGSLLIIIIIISIIVIF